MLVYIYLVVSLIFGSLGLGTLAHELDASAYKNLQKYSLQEEKIELPLVKADNFDSYALKNTGFSPKIYAKGALAYDIDTGQILYAFNEKEKLSLASLTKIMTAVIILENCEKENLDDVVTVSRDAALIEGSRMGLWIDEKIVLKDLIYGLILKSGNDAAKAIEEYYQATLVKQKTKMVGDYPNSENGIAGAKTPTSFIELMNNKAKELRMLNTFYKDTSGIDDGNLSTVYDQAILLSYAMRNPYFRNYMATVQYSASALNGPLKHEMTTTNRLLRTREDVLAGKTGYSEAAGWNMITLFKAKNDHRVATIVLGASGNDERFDESNRIIDWIYDSYRW